jgi:C_GCAxxG_C_C family probable redox protein
MSDHTTQKSKEYFKSGFCGGISRTSGMCGAVSRAIMAVNLFCGRQSVDESVERNYEAVRQLLKLFENKFNSTNCFDLTGCRLDTNEGQRQFEENNIIEECTSYIEEAARIAVEILECFS